MNKTTPDEVDARDAINALAHLHDYGVDIWRALDEPMSGQDIEQELDIPIATAYRTLSDLESAGLIEPEAEKTLRDETNCPAQRYVRKHVSITLRATDDDVMCIAKSRTALAILNEVEKFNDDSFDP